MFYLTLGLVFVVIATLAFVLLFIGQAVTREAENRCACCGREFAALDLRTVRDYGAGLKVLLCRGCETGQEA